MPREKSSRSLALVRLLGICGRALGSRRWNLKAAQFGTGLEALEARQLLAANVWISGTVYADFASSAESLGMQDLHDIGVPAWRVYLDADEDGEWDEDEPTTRTDASGRFTLSNLGQLAPEGVMLRVIDEDGWDVSFPDPEEDADWHLVIPPANVSGRVDITGFDFGVNPKDPLTVRGIDPFVSSGEGETWLTLSAHPGTVTAWHIDWGDGSSESIAPAGAAHTVNQNHVYPATGTYYAKVTAEHLDGTLTPVVPRNASWRIDEVFGGADGNSMTEVLVHDFGDMASAGNSHSDAAYVVRHVGQGKMLIAGYAQNSSSTSSADFLVALFKTDGTLDSSFGTVGWVRTDFDSRNDEVTELLIPNGQMALEGIFAIAGGTARRLQSNHPNGPTNHRVIALAAYEADGDLNLEFGGNTSGKVTLDFGSDKHLSLQAAAIDAEGRILLVAVETLTGTALGEHVYLARLLPDGTVDSTFGIPIQGTSERTGYMKYTMQGLLGAAAILAPLVEQGGEVEHQSYWIDAFDLNGSGAVGGAGGYSLAVSYQGPPPYEYTTASNVLVEIDEFGSLVPRTAASDYVPPFVVTDVVKLENGDTVVVGIKNSNGSGKLAAAKYITTWNNNQWNVSLDTSFGSDGILIIDDSRFEESTPTAELSAGGTITIVVRGKNGNGDYFATFRITTGGELDETFGEGGGGYAGGMAVVASSDFARPRGFAVDEMGSVVIAGHVEEDANNTNHNTALARFTPDGFRFRHWTLSATVSRLDGGALANNDPSWVELSLSSNGPDEGYDLGIKSWMISWGDGKREIFNVSTTPGMSSDGLGTLTVQYLFPWRNGTYNIRAFAFDRELDTADNWAKHRPLDLGYLAPVQTVVLTGLRSIDATIWDFDLPTSGTASDPRQDLDNSQLSIGQVTGVFEETLGADRSLQIADPTNSNAPWSNVATSVDSLANWFSGLVGVAGQEKSKTLRLYDDEDQPGRIYHFVTNPDVSNAVTDRQSSRDEEQYTPGQFHALDQSLGAGEDHFTMHARAYFRYNGEADLAAFMQLSTANDAWVFINNKLSIDLGGAHARLPHPDSGATQSPDRDPTNDMYDPAIGNVGYALLDDVPTAQGFEWEIGRYYPIDIFYAHRQSSDTPSFVLSTSLDIVSDHVTINEEDRFLTEAWHGSDDSEGGRYFEKLPGTETLEIPIAIEFDTTSSGHLRDAFELSLLDEHGRSLVVTVSGASETFFNWSEGLTELTASGVSVEPNQTNSYGWATHIVRLNVTGLTDGTVGYLKARLINNDTDTATSASIIAVPVSTDVGDPPAFSSDPNVTTPGAPIAIPPIDWDALDDVTHLFSPINGDSVLEYGPTFFQDTAGIVRADAFLQYQDQGGAVRGPMLIVLDNLLPRSGDLSDRLLMERIDGRTPDGKPFWNITADVFTSLTTGDGGLLGDNVKFRTDAFAVLNLALTQFDYDVQVLAQPNRAPAVDQIAIPQVLADDREYLFDFMATDPDGDDITEWRVEGPSGTSIDSDGHPGRLTWQVPEVTEARIETLRVFAKDSWGAWSEAYQIQVRIEPALANRAPQIVSAPVVTAIIGQEYVYDARAVDPDQDNLFWLEADGVEVVIPEGATWNNGQLRWTPTHEQLNQTFDVLLLVQDREPSNPPAGDVESDDQGFSVQVVADPVNHDPYFVTTPDELFQVLARTGPFQDLSSSGATLSNASVLDQDWVWLDAGETRTEQLTVSVPPADLAIELIFLIDQSDSMLTETKWLFGDVGDDKQDMSVIGRLFDALWQDGSPGDEGLFSQVHMAFVQIAPNEVDASNAKIFIVPPGNPTAGAWWNWSDLNALEPGTQDYRLDMLQATGDGADLFGEDGLESLDKLMDAFNSGGVLTSHAGAQRSVVLITDEDRSAANEDVFWSGIVARLRGDSALRNTSDDIVVHGVLSGSFFYEPDPPLSNYTGAFAGSNSVGDWTRAPLSLRGTVTSGTGIRLADGFFQYDHANTLAYSVFDNAGAQYLDMRTAISTEATGTGMIVFGYEDASNYSYASVNVSQRRMAIGSVAAGVRSEVEQEFNLELNNEEWIDVHVLVERFGSVARADLVLTRASEAWTDDGDDANRLLLSRHFDPIPLGDTRYIGLGVESGNVEFAYFFASPSGFGSFAPAFQYGLETFGAVEAVGRSWDGNAIEWVKTSGDIVDYAIINTEPFQTLVLHQERTPRVAWEFNNVRADYLSLSRATHGAVWDLGQLTLFDPPDGLLEQFEASFIDQIQAAALAHVIGIDSTSPIYRGARPIHVDYSDSNLVVTYEVDFLGDGLSQHAELTFLNGHNGSGIASLPLAFNPRYHYDARAIDPDEDLVEYDWPTVTPDSDTFEGALVWSWEPDINELPVGSFAVTATDGRGGFDEQICSVVVTEADIDANHDPVFGSFSAPIAHAGTRYTIALPMELNGFVWDLDADPIRLAIVGTTDHTPLPPNLSLNASTGVLTWEVDRFQATGTLSLDIRASDGRGGIASGVLEIQIAAPTPNDAPEFVTEPLHAAAVGHAYVYRPDSDDINDDRLTYDLARAPRGMGINPDTGELYWKPKIDQIGEQVVSLRVWDGRDGWDVQTFTVTVHARNAAPVWTPIEDVQWKVGVGFTVPLQVSDPDGDFLELSILEGPTGTSGPSINAQAGTLTWTTPTIGLHRIVLQADDTRGGVSTTAFTLDVAEDWPVDVQLIGNTTFVVGRPSTLEIRPTGSHLENSDLRLVHSLYVVLAPDMELDYVLDPTMTFNQSISLSWTPTQPGSARITFADLQIHDDSGQLDGFGFEFTVTAVEPADVLRIDSPAPRVMAHGVPFRHQMTLAQPLESVAWNLDVVSGPATGLQIDPDSGIITWTQPSTQDGMHGSAAIFDVTAVWNGQQQKATYHVPIVDNTAPVIRSSELEHVEDDTWVLRTEVIDRDQPDPADLEAHVRLFNGAILSTIDNGLTVEAVPGQPGRYTIVSDEFEIPGTVPEGAWLTFLWTVTDAHGESSQKSIRIRHDDPTTTNDPIFTPLPQGRTVIAAGQLYALQLLAEDLDGDELTFAFDTESNYEPPEGMTLTEGGFILWRPGPEMIRSAPYEVRVKVSDGTTTSDTMAFAIRVVSTPRNASPAITSAARRGAAANEAYVYEAAASDPDHDTVFWSFVEAPEEAQVDPLTGVVTWYPGVDRIGRHFFALRAEDLYGGFDVQRYFVDVEAINAPPRLLTTLPEIAAINEPLSVMLRAVDRDGSPVRFSVMEGTQALGSISDTHFDAASGEWRATWTWTPTQLAEARIAVRAEEDTVLLNPLGDDAEFLVRVVDAIVARQPQFEFEPVRFVLASDVYRQTVATSQPPSGYEVQYAATVNGTPVQVSDSTISWPPQMATSGVIRLEAWYQNGTEQGPSSFLEWEVAVRSANNAPVFGRGAIAPRWIVGPNTLDTTFTFRAKASDRDFDPLTYSLADPEDEELSIDPRTGVVVWQPTEMPDEDDYNFEVIVSDGMARVQQTFTVTVIHDDQPPFVAISAPSEVEIGRPFTIWVDAYDPSGVEWLQVWLEKQGTQTELTYVRVGSDGAARIDGLAQGTYKVLASVSDTLGNVDNQIGVGIGNRPTYEIHVLDPDNPAPRPFITSPGPWGIVREPVAVTGSIIDWINQGEPPATLTVWTRIYDDQYQLVMESASQSLDLQDDRVVVNASDGFVIDPTLLRNGSYTLALVAHDGNSEGVGYMPFNVDGELKLGNFRMSFTDLTVPVGGLPVSVQRTYDTLNADRPGELGFGWELDLMSAALTVDLDSTTPVSNPRGPGYVPAWTDGTRITVTLPDGSRQGFYFYAEPRGRQLGFGATIYDVRIAADPGNTAALEFVGDPFPGLIAGDEGGYTDFSGQWPFNPTLPDGAFYRDFVLGLQDGTQFVIDAQTGRTVNVKDLEGNRLEFTDGGVTGLNRLNEITAQIEFTRDQFGRITRVTHHPDEGIDPPQFISYAYDTAGNLVSFSNRNDESTLYAYGQNHVPSSELEIPPHYLTTITDARGVDVAKVLFRDDGRLDSIQDATGQSAKFQYDVHPTGPDGRTGYSETVEDAYENAIELIRDREGRVTRKIETVDAGTEDYRVTIYIYDANGFQTGVSHTFKPDAPEDRYTQSISPTNPEDADQWESRSTYDDLGNMLSQTDALGRTTHYTYDHFGNVETITRPGSGVTANRYDDRGRLTRTEDRATGQVTEYLYDDRGNLQALRRLDGEDEIEVSSFVYDRSGRILSSTRPAADGVGEPIAQHLVYDVFGRQTVSYRHWTEGEVSKTLVDRTIFDPEGRATQQMHYLLDGALALESAADLDSSTPQWLTQTFYDAVGNAIRTIDRYGAESRTFYDLRGSVSLTESDVKRWNGSAYETTVLATRVAYDNNGREIARTAAFDVNATEEAVPLTVMVYDSLGRVKQTTTYLVPFDSLGDVISVTQMGATTVWNSLFDPSRLNSNPSWQRTQNESHYDDEGRVSSSDSRSWDGNGWREESSTSFTYNDDGAQETVTHIVDLDQSGSFGLHETLTTTNEYDPAGRLWRVHSPAGSAADGGAELVTEYVYDTTGRVTHTIQLGDLLTTEDDITVETHYDALGRREAATDARGRTTSYEYDDDGRLTAVLLPEVFDPIARVYTRPTYEYEYDAYGNMVKITTPGVIDTHTRTTSFVFDWYGRQIRRTLPLGVATTSDPDDFTESMVHSDAPIGTGAVRSSARAGQLDRSIDFEGRVTLRLYDNSALGGGRLVEQVHFRNAAAANAYDTTSLSPPAASSLSPDVERFVYLYDAFGRLIETQHDHNDAADELHSRTVRNTYDAEGRMIRMHSPEGVIEYTHDALGRMTSSQTRRGWDGEPDQTTDFPVQQRTSYEHDALGRIIRVNVEKRNGNANDGEHTRYFYDRAGNLARQEFGLTHDPLNPEDDPIHVRARWTFDDFGRIATLTWGRYHAEQWSDIVIFRHGTDMEAGYNKDGSKRFVREEWDELNTDFGAGSTRTVEVRWTYDTLNRLTNERFDLDPGSSAPSFYAAQYTLDIAGNRLSKIEDYNGTDLAGNPLISDVDVATTYAYDLNDRLLSEFRDVPDDPYDRHDQITEYAWGEWDVLANRYLGTEQTGKSTLEIIVDDSEFPVLYNPSLRERTEYGYSLRGRLDSARTTRHLADGDPAQNPDGVLQGGTLATYAYDERGLRFLETSQGIDDEGDLVGVPSSRLIYFDSSNPTGYAQIVEELVRDGQGAWQVVRTNTLGLDVISTSVASGDRGLTHGQGDDAPLALVYDAGGSTRGLFASVFTSGQPFVELTGGVEDDAASVQIYDYDAFGQLVRLSAALLGDRTSNPTTDPGGIQHWRFAKGTPNSVLTDAQAAAALTNLLYRGEQFDAHLGMQYLRARHYDLATGRFGRVDPFSGEPSNPLSFHKYGYAHDDPIQMVDPTGQFALYLDVLASLKNMGQRYGYSAAQGGRAYKTASQLKNLARSMQKFASLADRIWDSVAYIQDFIDLLDFDLQDLKQLSQHIGGLRGIPNQTVRFNLPNGIRKTLDALTGPAGGIKNPVLAEFLGTALAAATTQLLGFRTTDLRAKYHGLDGLLYDDLTNRFVVVEAKGGKGKLAPGQMDDRWIDSRLRKIIRDNPPSPDRQRLQSAIVGQPMWALVVSTDFSRSSGEYAAMLQTYPNVGRWGSPFQ